MKYRKKTVDVDAKQWFPPGDERHDPRMLTRDLTDKSIGTGRWEIGEIEDHGSGFFMVRTTDGDFYVKPGDWIFTDISNGDVCWMENDRFVERYEPVNVPVFDRVKRWLRRIFRRRETAEQALMRVNRLLYENYRE